MLNSDPHSMTLATACGRRLCKTRYANGRVDDYSAARIFDLTAVQAHDLATLAGLLGVLAGRRDTCVLRGAIRDPHRSQGVRRLLHPDASTGDAPTLAETPRAWLALDLDGLPLPAGTDPRDLHLCGRVARAALPAPFHGAACVVAATAGHGFKDGARLRLWFLLDRALSGDECKRWLRDAPVDLSVFGAVQPIYTAAPLFRGMADPLPVRLVTLDGAERVAPPAETQHVRAAPHTPGLLQRPGQYALHALTRAYGAVAAAPEGARHPTAVAEAWGLALLVEHGLLAESDVARAIDHALQVAGKPAGEGQKIVTWAVAQRARNAE